MTRKAAPVTPPVVCTVAGSDSGGGAGVQADLKTVEAGGGFGTSVVTSVTAQNTTGVESTHVLPVEEVDAQATAVFEDFDVAAVKTGMLATAPVVELVAERVAGLDCPAVVDPVMVAASGDRLLEPAAEDAYEELVAGSTLVTPNVDEAEVLTGREVTDPESATAAGEDLVGMGADAALVKGGHLGGEDVVDVLVTADTVETLRHARVDTTATHGSGCTLSSAIATRLAHGDDLPAAVRSGVDLLARAVRYNVDVGGGPGAVHHAVALRDRAARQPTAERVEWVLRDLIERDVSPLVPEVGMNVAGATPYAETAGECAAVEGRVTRTLDGVASPRGVRFGASTHVAGALLAAREADADLRFAANCRYDDAIATALSDLEGAVVEYDREDHADGDGREDGAAPVAIRRGVEAAVTGADRSPVAAVGTGGAREPLVTLFAPGAGALVDRVTTLLDAV
ncbi:bifunctional hydroxymethylpyrimidine kinase/phosphomethylpyrimidine kinase [Salinirussus salinus]|uniref:bifunctional hydroxymethylpyrimidine kinase/phosphomethylpyrimidine kinase n=1 Tax=Salinirussus salinus TaxID=1198300 RepID=UPI00135A225B|nr:bifunctional hydroxymethylpyrimidine kinase/phosphomethylpyrimidine kinase [Salinirussus salinus]